MGSAKKEKLLVKTHKKKNEKSQPPSIDNSSRRFFHFIYQHTLGQLSYEFYQINQGFQEGLINSKQLKKRFIECFNNSRLKYLLTSVFQGKNCYFSLKDLVEVLSEIQENHRSILYRCILLLQNESDSGWSGDTTTNFYWHLTKTDIYQEAKSDDTIRILVNQLAPAPFAYSFAAEFISQITVIQVFKPMKDALSKVVKKCGGVEKFTSQLTSLSISVENPKSSVVPKLSQKFIDQSLDFAIQYYLSTIHTTLKALFLIPQIIKNNWGTLFQIAIAEFYQTLKRENEIIEYQGEMFIISIRVERIDQRFDDDKPSPTVLKFVYQPCVYLIKASESESDAVLLIKASMMRRSFPATHMIFEEVIFPVRAIVQVADITTTQGLGGHIDLIVKSEKKKKSWAKDMAAEFTDCGLSDIFEELHEGNLKFLLLFKEYARAVLLYPAQCFLKTVCVGYTNQLTTFDFEVTQYIGKRCAKKFLQNRMAQIVFIKSVLALGRDFYKRDLHEQNFEKMEMKVKPKEAMSDILYLFRCALSQKHVQFKTIQRMINELINDEKMDDEVKSKAKSKFTEYFNKPLSYHIIKSKNGIAELKTIVESVRKLGTVRRTRINEALDKMSDLFMALGDISTIREFMIRLKSAPDYRPEMLCNQRMGFFFHQHDQSNDRLTLNEFAKELGLSDLISFFLKEDTSRKDKKYNFFSSRDSSKSYSLEETLHTGTFSSETESESTESEVERKKDVSTPDHTPRKLV